MREIFKYGSVGRAPGNRCLYPEIGAPLFSLLLRKVLVNTEKKMKKAGFLNKFW